MHVLTTNTSIACKKCLEFKYYNFVYKILLYSSWKIVFAKIVAILNKKKKLCILYFKLSIQYIFVKKIQLPL